MRETRTKKGCKSPTADLSGCKCTCLESIHGITADGCNLLGQFKGDSLVNRGSIGGSRVLRTIVCKPQQGNPIPAYLVLLDGGDFRVDGRDGRARGRSSTDGTRVAL